MKSLTFLVLLTTLTAVGQSPRNIGDEHGVNALRHDVASLPVNHRAEVLHAISAALELMDPKDDNYVDPQDVPEVLHTLLFERFGNITFVQTTDTLSCGPDGNCGLFALDRFHHVLVATRAHYLTVQKTVHNGSPDFQTGLPTSVFQTVRTWYRFDGDRYHAIRCADDNWNFQYKKWDRNFKPCK